MAPGPVEAHPGELAQRPAGRRRSAPSAESTTMRPSPVAAMPSRPRARAESRHLPGGRVGEADRVDARARRRPPASRSPRSAKAPRASPGDIAASSSQLRSGSTTASRVGRPSTWWSASGALAPSSAPRLASSRSGGESTDWSSTRVGSATLADGSAGGQRSGSLRTSPRLGQPTASRPDGAAGRASSTKTGRTGVAGANPSSTKAWGDAGGRELLEARPARARHHHGELGDVALRTRPPPAAPGRSWPSR